MHPLFCFLRHICRDFLRLRASQSLQLAGDLLEACNSDVCLRTDVLFDELATTMPIGNPVGTASFPGFLPGGEVSAIPGVKVE